MKKEGITDDIDERTKLEEEVDYENFEYESFDTLLQNKKPGLDDGIDINRLVDADSKRNETVKKRMNYLTGMSAIGGFLFGYDTGVISGAMLPISRIMSLNNIQQEVVVSSTILAAFFSSLFFGGPSNQLLGRRFTILISTVAFTFGSLLLALAPGYGVLVIGRIIVGIGIGLASLTTPVYIAEVATPSRRGALVTINTLFVCLGQFSAGMVDGIFSYFEENGWRFMLGFAGIPSVIMFHGFCRYLPESPRWLASRGREEEAKQVLCEFRNTDEEVEQELKDIMKTMKAKSRDKNNLFIIQLLELLKDQPTRNALKVGCGLMILQQFCGINTIMYYAATIYEMSGFDEKTSIWLSGFTALAQSASLIVSIYLIERVGRRKLILASLFFVSCSLFGLGMIFYFTRIQSAKVLHADTECYSQSAIVWDGVTRYCYDCIQIDNCGYSTCDNACLKGSLTDPPSTAACSDDNLAQTWFYDICEDDRFLGYLSVLFMIIYLFSFGVGMGGLPWTINSEIYPLHHRSMATSISTATNWISNMIISATFLSLSSSSGLTRAGAFFLYCCIAFAGVAWIYVVLPETKGKSLEEIEDLFRDGDADNNITDFNDDCSDIDLDYDMEDESF